MINVNALFTGHEQGLTITIDPIDLAALLVGKVDNVEHPL